MKFIFWCEFPDKVNWKELNNSLEELNLNIVAYITCTSKEQLKKYKSKRIEVDAWPVLSKEKGYWFSSFTKKEDIDSLDKFKGTKIKLDIEPPIFKGDYTPAKSIFWLLLSFLKPAKNKLYLQEKIKSFNNDVIVSTFPLPKFLLKHWGWCKATPTNYMFYSTFIPKLFRFIYKFFYKFFILLNKDSYFTIGLSHPGIFNTEPVYKNIKEFKDDIQFMKNNKVKTVVIYSLEGTTKQHLKLIKASS